MLNGMRTWSENTGTIRDAKEFHEQDTTKSIMKYVLMKSDTYAKKTINEPFECLKLHLTSKKQDGGKWGVIYLLVVERLYLSYRPKRSPT
jgi:hypothetical protein